ncbi:hypothetical protein HYC85_021001 [Camellia sinensis]|uniref:Uncharacterized protein n=1 Tax=Camellia sinensis TaxID=4442 RepID=A0A7J7GK48_CAMSI|nr:hypothetical protein HYC85_021001 [Camellia sinensis]
MENHARASKLSLERRSKNKRPARASKAPLERQGQNLGINLGDSYINICNNLVNCRVKVSKLSQLSKLPRDNNTTSNTIEADRLHTMFLAKANARAVLIKLADRLHNMMTLDALPLVKQQRFAKETLEIFAPLANRLGISSWKEKLENLCFKYLYPDEHKELSSNLMKSFDEAMVASAVEKLEQVLEDAAISYHDLSGRHKSLYQSLHTVVMGEGMVPLEVQIRRKTCIYKRSLDLQPIRDTRKVIVNTLPLCFKWLIGPVGLSRGSVRR